MKFKSLCFFVGPSIFMMLLFIAFPLGTVAWQSLHITQPIYELVEVETCTPGFLKSVCNTETKSRPQLDADGRIIQIKRFVGLDNYKSVLELDRVAGFFKAGSWHSIKTIDFWKALRFTVMFTLITLPLVVGLGLLIALAVNNTVASLRGPVIFISLLPFIITPVVGALSVRWLFIGDGILTAALEKWLQRDIALFAQGWTIEILMYVYRVWHVAPFAFLVFYAGLQTVNKDVIESAIVDGASRFERLRYIVVPHLMPLIMFVTLIHLMDAYRVFEEIVGFSAQAHVISLQWLTYDFLMPNEAGVRFISRASASAMLTIVGIVLLLIYPLRKTWLERGR